MTSKHKMPPSYFETQSSRNCSVHGVNNYFQEKILTCRELELVKIWIKKTYKPNRAGNYNDHFTDEGFFSADTLFRYVEETYGNPQPMMLASVGFRPPEMIFAILRDNDRIVAVEVRSGWKHTVAAIKEGDAWYLLDSVKDGPIGPLSPKQLIKNIRRTIIYAENRPPEIPEPDDSVVEIDSKMFISSLHRFVR